MANILIVDDSPTILKSLELVLHREGHNIRTAPDALTAVASLQSHEPDLILLDIMLAGVGGIELCMMIRRNPRHQDLPILMITASRNHVGLAYQCGANGYLTKPVASEALIGTINEFLLDKPSESFEVAPEWQQYIFNGRP